MQITDYLRPEGIRLQVQADDKAAAIHALVELMAACGKLNDPEAFEADVLAREAQGSTGVGGGIAIPHGKSAAVTAPGLVAMTLQNDLDYAALDGAPVRLLFLIAAPDNANDLHIQVLADLAKLLLDPVACASLLAAKTPAEFLQCIAATESPSAPAEPPPQPFRVLAVTACPTGIAHTYMAAEALQNKAAELGISLKVETNGATGVQNALTEEDIAQASGIIVAADKAVATARFAGKPVVTVKVSQAMREPEALLRRAAAGDAPLMPEPAADPPPDEVVPGKAERKGERGWVHQMYTHLMSGVSHMIPFVTGGGILIALSYLIGRIGLGATWFGGEVTLAQLLYRLGKGAFAMMYPVLAAYIAVSLADLPALLPGFMGGYLAQNGMVIGPESEWVASGFLGALAAGFAAGAIIIGLRRLFEKLPAAMDQIRVTVIYPVGGLILIGALMVLVVNPPLGQFNSLIYQQLHNMEGGSRVVMGAALGGLMAVDYGGPINKAAYLFGTVALASEEYDIMAAVMVGGMTPPIGVALSCSLFPRKFTRKERQTALGNYLLGVSFVTEGALPFALRDPLRVMPACIAGSALAGALSMAYGCGVPAPHGGLYLLPLTTNAVQYLIALLGGSVLTAVIMGTLKPTLPEELSA